MTPRERILTPLPTTEQRRARQAGTGRAFLIGAGPGDPDLLTIKALRCLRQADVVVYDRLIPECLLAEARPGAELIFVGKSSGHHTLPQDEINALLVDRARRGATVARLKGGDPFVFGRGGEEAAALAAARIPFEVVPGVSAAIAVPAYAGIPVTHRGSASLVTIVTGHDDTDAMAAGVDWHTLAHTNGTIVVMMGVAALPDICRQLAEGGLATSTAVAIIERGTTPDQRVVMATLASAAQCAAEASVAAPAVIVIGDVAALHSTLAWYVAAATTTAVAV